MTRRSTTLSVLTVAWFTFALPLMASGYSLDDWLSVSSVDSFSWAPDGSAIYYTTNAAASGTTQIFRLELQGGTTTQLTRPADGARA